MKIYIYLSAAVICLLFFQFDVTAQKKKAAKRSPDKKVNKIENPGTDRNIENILDKKSVMPTDKKVVSTDASTKAQTQDVNIYLKADNLFKNVAQETTSIEANELEDFAQSVETKLSDEARPEREAATFLIQLQDDPRTFIKEFRNENATSQQKSLQANELITEFVKRLILASSSGNDDPLLELINELDSVEGQRLLKEDLFERLGSGIEREYKAAFIFVQIKAALSKEALDELRKIIRSNTQGAIFPFPFCLLRKPCPR